MKVLAVLALSVLFGAWTHSSALAQTTLLSGAPITLSQRVILNVNLYGGYDYAFINHLTEGDVTVSPSGSAWNTGTVWNSAILDAAGWPNNAANGRNFGGGVRIPDSSNFAGPYCLDGLGTGRINMPPSGTFTEAAGVTCANGVSCGSGFSKLSNGRWDVTDSGSGWCIAFNFSGARQLISWTVQLTDPSATGAYIRNLRLYRAADATDLTAGKIFRSAYKQPIVNLNPAAVRFMNWGPGNNASLNIRFENRISPFNAGLASGAYWNLLPYGETTGTNQYALAGVSGTPVAMQHGEILTARIGTATTVNTAATVTAVTNSNPGQVTTSAPHGFTTGDQIVHVFGNGTMPNLNYLPVTITVVDPTNYTIGRNTTGDGTYTSCGNATCYAAEYLTLNVGSRGAYPIIRLDGKSQLGSVGIGLAAAAYQTFCFDKNSAAQTDGSANWVYGAWLTCGNQANFGTPIEIETAFVNELNAMSPAHPIHMYVTMPQMALVPSDPDYTTGSDWPVNTVKAIMTGANGFSGLCVKCSIVIEFSNETWNIGGSFLQSFYLARQGFLRWPAGGQNDFNSFQTLRSMLVMRDIQASPYAGPRIKYVMAGQAGTGTGPGNQVRYNGDTLVNTDPLNPIGGAAPMTMYDYFAIAPYLQANTAFEKPPITAIARGNPTVVTITGTNNFVIGQSATVASVGGTTGLNGNTYAILGVSGQTVSLDVDSTGMGAYTSGGTVSYLSALAAQYAGHAGNAVAQEADCALYVAGIVSATSASPSGGGTTSYEAIMSQLATVMAGFGTTKSAINYEGGWNRDVTSETTQINAFLVAAQGSQSWATAQVGFLQYVSTHANMQLPAVYVVIDQRWGYAFPDTYSGGVEGAGYNATWGAMSTFDAGFPYLLERDLDPAGNDNRPMWLDQAA